MKIFAEFESLDEVQEFVRSFRVSDSAQPEVASNPGSVGAGAETSPAADAVSAGAGAENPPAPAALEKPRRGRPPKSAQQIAAAVVAGTYEPQGQALGEPFVPAASLAPIEPAAPAADDTSTARADVGEPALGPAEPAKEPAKSAPEKAAEAASGNDPAAAEESAKAEPPVPVEELRALAAKVPRERRQQILLTLGRHFDATAVSEVKPERSGAFAKWLKALETKDLEEVEKEFA